MKIIIDGKGRGKIAELRASRAMELLLKEVGVQDMHHNNLKEVGIIIIIKAVDEAGIVSRTTIMVGVEDRVGVVAEIKEM